MSKPNNATGTNDINGVVATKKKKKKKKRNAVKYEEAYGYGDLVAKVKGIVSGS